MTDMKEYALPVHRSLLEPELMLGVPQIGLAALLGFVFIFGFLLEMYFMLIPAAVLYVIMRVLTKKDPFLVDIIAEHLNQKDVYLP